MFSSLLEASLCPLAGPLRSESGASREQLFKVFRGDAKSPQMAIDPEGPQSEAPSARLTDTNGANASHPAEMAY